MNLGIPYYPSKLDLSFRDKLMRKKEYIEIRDRVYREKELKVLHEKAYQSVLTTFISPSSPYNRLLIVHGVGTGKSSCSIKIVEKNLSVMRKAIVLNKGETATQNFKREVEKHGKSFESFFQYNTYTKFSRYIQSLSKEKWVDEFNNVIFILDEIHNVITAKYANDEKTYSSLLELFDNVPNCIVIGMTATPMRDQYIEIFPLLNMFTLPSMRIKDSFTSSSSYDKLSHLISTSVSFYQTQFNFEVIPVGERRDELNQITCYVEMQGIQKQCYTNQVALTLGRGESSFTYKKEVYASLCALSPNNCKSDDYLTVQEVPHETGVHVIYDIKEELREEVRNNIINYSCKMAFMLDVFENTTKYYQSKITHKSKYSLTNNGGLSYIFCENIRHSGIFTLIALFRLFGYEYYTGGSVETLGTNRRRFTVFTGNKHICPNQQERLEFFTHPRNSNGDYCSILIASNVMKEAISLKEVRNVFILTPHWNFSSIEQAEGRAIRRDTFHTQRTLENDFHPSVRIYRLAAVCDTSLTPSSRQEMIKNSVDMYKIYKSSEKNKKIQEIMDLLKEYAIDRFISMEPESYPTIKPNEIDYSTYMMDNDSLLDKIVKVVCPILHNQILHLLDVCNTIRKREIDIQDIVLFNCIEKIISTQKIWYDSLGNAFVIREKNDYLYLSRIHSNSVSSSEIIYHRRYLSSYVNKRKAISNIPHVLEHLDQLNIYDFAVKFLEYISSKLTLLEEVIQNPLKYPNVFNYLKYNIYYFYSTKYNKKLYFHTMDTRHERTTAYSTTTKKIQSIDIVMCASPDGIVQVGDDEMIDVVKRINVIRKCRDLDLALRYGIYASISLTDKGKRIHNVTVDTDPLWIDRIEDILSESEEEGFEGVYEDLDIESNKCKKRGRLIHTLEKVAKIACIRMIDNSNTNWEEKSNNDLDNILWSRLVRMGSFIIT